jgi:hypothetical protein
MLGVPIPLQHDADADRKEQQGQVANQQVGGRGDALQDRGAGGQGGEQQHHAQHRAGQWQVEGLNQ